MTNNQFAITNELMTNNQFTVDSLNQAYAKN